MSKQVKLYSKGGDRGESGVMGGKRLPKNDLVFEVLGGVDEVNSLLGLVISEFRIQSFGKAQDKNSEKVVAELMRVQNILIAVGAVVAGSEKVEIEESEVEWLEERIDYYQGLFGEDWYKRFLLPGGVEAAARLDVARAVCRRVERTFVGFRNQIERRDRERLELVGVYLNRLSDYLFALRCYVNHEAGYDEREFV